MKRKRRKPLGKPLPKATDEDIEVTAEDIEQAKEWARQNGTPRMIALLEAEAAGNEEFE